jgi:hypothetical protein
MRIGTKSVLFGAHCFFLHPWFVALGWWKLYGFPFDPRLWVAFFVHDLGYIGKPNMDGPEGERHVEFGAKIMSRIFDPLENYYNIYLEDGTPIGKWGQFSLYHSRYYAKANGVQPSRLCFADKLSFPLTPRWLYLPAVTATGEINEYLKNAQKADSGHWKPTGYDKKLWHKQLCEYMIKWVNEHKDGAQDTWTDAKRHAKTDSGVWQ